MLRDLTLVVLTVFIRFQMSDGQNAFVNNDNPFSFGAPSFSDASDPSFVQDSISSALLNSGNNFQIRTEPSTLFSQEVFPASELSSSISSTNQNSSTANPSPVENFVTKFNSAVYNSKVLPYIFDIKELSPEAFSKFLYDNVFSRGPHVFSSNPQNITSIVSIPNIDRINTYTPPILLDIYSNAIAKYLFNEGTLDLSNISFAPRKYARILEKRAKRCWKKETPESKFLALGDGFIDYMRSIDHFTTNTMNGLANYFANEVQRVGNKF
ncbi:uncharacterized protein LOC129976588 [Argiope bruennichi]|uniref:Uncharacterized protein n=1 Tax=Argiope bruennichi TaxID=94029 RepID=A0A8T0EPT8_ARGBR|nr:uncharacterized protein LOC129976588 [Argiope bruennichi]KAF8777391.1 hypothetical protein HNY73_014259 [Argiope bruennichi]